MCFFISDQHLSVECFILKDNEKAFIWQTTIDEKCPLDPQMSQRSSYSAGWVHIYMPSWCTLT